MTAIARVTTTNRLITANSTVTIFEDDVRVSQADVPERTEHAGRLAPARICAAIAALGYRPVDYHKRQRMFDETLGGIVGHVDIDVERVA